MAFNSVSFGCNFCKEAQSYREKTGVPGKQAKGEIKKLVAEKIAKADKPISHKQAAQEVCSDMKKNYHHVVEIYQKPIS